MSDPRAGRYVFVSEATDEIRDRLELANSIGGGRVYECAGCSRVKVVGDLERDEPPAGLSRDEFEQWDEARDVINVPSGWRPAADGAYRCDQCGLDAPDARKRCTKCGHAKCPCCPDWCDTLIEDGELCCDGECTYAEAGRE